MHFFFFFSSHMNELLSSINLDLFTWICWNGWHRLRTIAWCWVDCHLHWNIVAIFAMLAQWSTLVVVQPWSIHFRIFKSNSNGKFKRWLFDTQQKVNLREFIRFAEQQIWMQQNCRKMKFLFLTSIEFGTIGTKTTSLTAHLITNYISFGPSKTNNQKPDCMKICASMSNEKHTEYRVRIT